MTLDIERERLEFSEYFKRGPAAAYMGWVEINKRFRDPAVQENFDTWLAAKRAAVGSAEPVATLILGGIDGNELEPNDIECNNRVIEALQDKLIRTSEPMYLPLYTAPPAPVSAEPIYQKESEVNKGMWLDVKKSEYEQYKHRNYRVVYLSAPPSTNAKDSELLGVLKIAEAALSDIGDATREPGDDIAWLETRAAKDLPIIRAAIAAKGTEK